MGPPSASPKHNESSWFCRLPAKHLAWIQTVLFFLPLLPQNTRSHLHSSLPWWVLSSWNLLCSHLFINYKHFASVEYFQTYQLAIVKYFHVLHPSLDSKFPLPLPLLTFLIEQTLIFSFVFLEKIGNVSVSYILSVLQSPCWYNYCSNLSKNF